MAALLATTLEHHCLEKQLKWEGIGETGAAGFGHH